MIRGLAAKDQRSPMQRFLDKWGLWIALVVIGSIIAYGLISGYLKQEEPSGKGPNKTATKSFN
jgi:hypothetical protein